MHHRPDYDPRLEWDRDGQYFHYLIRWMHALHRVGQETGDITYHRSARELAAVAHGRLHLPAGGHPVWIWTPWDRTGKVLITRLRRGSETEHPLRSPSDPPR